MALTKIIKGDLHPRNYHNGRYDFEKLIAAYPELSQFVAENKFGDLSIDFFNPKAVKSLNKALLLYYYGIEFWDIPHSALTPPIPGRADYIHYIADLISQSTSQNINCLDIGVGANCIYPIIGCSQYGWNFVGSDIDINSVKNAQNIVSKNTVLQDKVEIRHQQDKTSIFKGIISLNEHFDVSICNPPFHDSPESAEKGSLRKLRNLKGKNVLKSTLNFGGKSNELWCEGGELRFITDMIHESKLYKNNVEWFTTLVSKEDNLKVLENELKKIKVAQIKTINMSQGNKKSRILAWKF
ncbi:MAG: 23S rRNA (adenine(1618)-N(6))-methyltransferase RlmF [Rikenellaceae bacterium]